MSLQTPLAKVRGLGPAKEGVRHWWAQRVSAIALAPLSFFVLWLVVQLRHADYLAAKQEIAKPWIAAALIAFIGTFFYHGKLGLQVVIEDYVHTPALEIGLQLAVKLLAAMGALLGIFAIVRISLGA
jgi:succinate dehydrogenase / fumarate reductase, membrane anchor subunit